MRSAENFPFGGKFSEVYMHLKKFQEHLITFSQVPRPCIHGRGREVFHESWADKHLLKVISSIIRTKHLSRSTFFFFFFFFSIQYGETNKYKYSSVAQGTNGKVVTSSSSSPRKRKQIKNNTRDSTHLTVEKPTCKVLYTYKKYKN